MKKVSTYTKEEQFITIVARINGYFIMMGVFYLVYFFLQTEVDVFLFLLALLNMAFALLSVRHLAVTSRLVVELQRARSALEEIVEAKEDTTKDR
ncbi:MAG: hypothetical protein ABIG92_00870 [Candidatus Omnitrophota bacterium]